MLGRDRPARDGAGPRPRRGHHRRPDATDLHDRGPAAAIELKREVPQVGVLVLSQYVETRHAVDLLAGGHTGVGYLLKERITRPEELVDAVQRSRRAAPRSTRKSFAPCSDTPRRDDPIARLTTKEREVLGLVAEGHSNDRIAERLDITTRTVESHTSRIFTKLGLEADPATHRRVLAVLAHLRSSAAPPR